MWTPRRPARRFAALVDDPVMLDGKVVIPRSAVVVVQAVSVAQSGTMKGSDKISLKANSISFGGQTYEVVTAYVEAKGSGEGKKTRTKDWWRCRPGCHRRRHRRWRVRRGDWCGGGRGHWRRGRQPGSGALEAAGRNTPAVPVERGGHGQAIAAIRVDARRAPSDWTRQRRWQRSLPTSPSCSAARCTSCFAGRASPTMP